MGFAEAVVMIEGKPDSLSSLWLAVQDYQSKDVGKHTELVDRSRARADQDN